MHTIFLFHLSHFELATATQLHLSQILSHPLRSRQINIQKPVIVYIEGWRNVEKNSNSTFFDN